MLAGPNVSRHGSHAMNPTYGFRGQVALVTGAAPGMGLSTAKAFPEASAAAVLADLNEETLGRAAADLEAMGQQVLAVLCGASDEDQVGGTHGRADSSTATPSRRATAGKPAA